MRGIRRRACLHPIIIDQRGATAVEYGLILALIFLAVSGGVAALGGSVQDKWDDIANRVTSA
jgi:pilus assembly protein Flp/PilA